MNASAGRPRKEEFNYRIMELLSMGFGRQKIYQILQNEGAKIARSTVGIRVRELREANAEGRLAEYLARGAQLPKTKKRRAGRTR
jgi:hypothetical protein